jgi:hypothetical protein
VDKLAAVMNKVDSVKLVLQENVQVALANCVTLDNIEKAAGACARACVEKCGGGLVCVFDSACLWDEPYRLKALPPHVVVTLIYRLLPSLFSPLPVSHH